MGNKKGIYRDRIEIIGDLASYQGNDVGRRNWLKKLNEHSPKVVVKLVSQNESMNELLERVIDLGTVEIRFPHRDIPEQPRCNGELDRTTGEINHLESEECSIHKVPTHTHAIETTPDYWDCDCEVNYIHKKTNTLECSFCQSSQEEQPDSRVNEVNKHLFTQVY